MSKEEPNTRHSPLKTWVFCICVKEMSKSSMKFFQTISQTPWIDKHIFWKILHYFKVVLIYFLEFGCHTNSRAVLMRGRRLFKIRTKTRNWILFINLLYCQRKNIFIPFNNLFISFSCLIISGHDSLVTLTNFSLLNLAWSKYDKEDGKHLCLHLPWISDSSKVHCLFAGGA